MAHNRNHILDNILTAEGGTPDPEDAMIEILEKSVIASGGTVTIEGNRNSVLNDYIEAKGGTRLASTISRNPLIAQIITDAGCTPDDLNNRNSLYRELFVCIAASPVTYDGSPLTYAGNGLNIVYI